MVGFILKLKKKLNKKIFYRKIFLYKKKFLYIKKNCLELNGKF